MRSTYFQQPAFDHTHPAVGLEGVRAGAGRALVEAAGLGSVDRGKHGLPVRVLHLVVALLPVVVMVVPARLVVLAAALHACLKIGGLACLPVQAAWWNGSEAVQLAVERAL